MPRLIIKLTEDDQSWYLEYSTVVDAPITYGMSLEEFKNYYKDEYGNYGLGELEIRLKRVDEKGTSSHLYSSIEDTIDCNRAGVGETTLSKQQLIDYYCKRIITELPLGKKLDYK